MKLILVIFMAFVPTCLLFSVKMDALPDTPYLQMHPDTLQMVRKEINMEKPGEMKDAVRILDEWVKQQPYFMEKYIPLRYLEMTIVTSKGSMERAKKLIKNICMARTLRPEYFEPRNVREYYEVFKEHCSVIAMPKLTSENYRLVIVKVKGKVNNTSLNAVYKYLYGCLDYLKVNDYHSGIVMIFDMTETHMQHFITNANLFEVGNCLLTCLDAYGLRLKKCHMITPSKAIQTILSIFKTFMSKKVMDRVVVNESGEELLKYYSKDVLPNNYGGDDKTIYELQDEILNICQDEHIKHMKIMNKVQIDKSMCSISQFNYEDGIQGTFRSLNID